MDYETILKALNLAITYHRDAAQLYFEAFNKYVGDNPALADQLQMNCEYHKQQQFQMEQQLRETNEKIATINNERKAS